MLHQSQRKQRIRPTSSLPNRDLMNPACSRLRHHPPSSRPVSHPQRSLAKKLPNRRRSDLWNQGPAPAARDVHPWNRRWLMFRHCPQIRRPLCGWVRGILWPEPARGRFAIWGGAALAAPPARGNNSDPPVHRRSPANPLRRLRHPAHLICPPMAIRIRMADTTWKRQCLPISQPHHRPTRPASGF